MIKKNTLLKVIHLWLLIVSIGFLSAEMTYGATQKTLSKIQTMAFLSLRNYAINSALKILYNHLMHDVICNILKINAYCERPVSQPNGNEGAQGNVPVDTVTESLKQLHISQNTHTEKPTDQQISENINHLLRQLKILEKTMTRNPEWRLVLLWDIDETVIYDRDNPEVELYTILEETFDTLRQNKQLLLIYNTARSYYSISFKNWRYPFPKPDILISLGGSKYFFNRYINKPLFEQTSWFRNFHPALFINSVHWDRIRPIGCSCTIGSNSLKVECPFFEESSITSTLETLSDIAKTTTDEYRYWHQPREQSSTTIFAYHNTVNKGAAFSRLMNGISKEIPSFRNKTKIVISAGDSLPDTAMMHPDMHYPFNDKYQEAELTPKLPANTAFAGAVLSKAGELQNERFAPLFEGIETVNSKSKSILGIVEGTVTLLLRFAPLDLMPPEL